jgi:uncharacterized protein
MLFAIITNDKKDGLDLRLSTRPEHVKYLESLGETLVFAGPFLDDEGQSNGSLVMVEADNLAQAEQIAAGDPFQIAGLFASSSVRPWKWTINNKEGR